MKAKIWNYSAWISETRPRVLFDIFDAKLHAAGFSVIKHLEHYFTPQGYTAIWLLGESHFALHTFPEEGKTYIELSSCNEEKHQKFLTL